MSLFKKKSPNAIKKPLGDSILNWVTGLILLLFLIIVAYPMIYVISASVSSGKALQAGRVLLWPIEPNMDGYIFVFGYEQVWLGLRNTLFYVVTRTIFSVACLIVTSYPLARTNFQGRRAYTAVVVTTMLVGAGMVPSFIINTQVLGMYNTIWPVIILGAIGASNVFILRTSFKSGVPTDLYDAAEIDGANDFQTMLTVAVPLCKATISVITLWIVIGTWNSYWTAMMYIRDDNLMPLQMFMRNILMSNQIDPNDADNSEMVQNAALQLQYALIVIMTVPCLLFHSIVEKFFQTGIMVGSVKG